MVKSSFRFRFHIILPLLLLTLISCGDQITTYHSEGVTVIPGSLTISTQTELSHLTGVKQILGDLIISTDPQDDPIQDISPLSELIYVRGDFKLINLRYLSSLTHLSSLEIVGEDIFITGLSILRNLHGLESLRGVGSQIMIVSNPLLESITGLSGLREMMAGNISISNNAALNSLRGLEGLRRLAIEEGHYGSLDIRHCPGLTNLAGLENLEELNQLKLRYCTGLTDISALSHLERLHGELAIIELPSLTNLSGLENLNHCPSIYLDNLPALTSLIPLSPAGISRITLTGIGLQDLVSVPPLNTNTFLGISCNPYLHSLDGLELPVELSGFAVSDCDSITDLSILSGCAITGAIEVSKCDLLTNINGFEATTLLTGGLSIEQNENLNSLAGLANLDSITNSAWITYNPTLCDTLVDEFIAGIAIGGSFSAHDNAPCGPPPATPRRD